MKFVSALVLVCAFVCASAQFGVKGGSNGVRVGSFFPRVTAGSIQEKKEQLQLANVEEVSSGPSVGSNGASGNTFVQPAVQQQENVVTLVQERPSQQVLVPTSGSVSSLPSVVPQSQSSFSFIPSFQPVLPAPVNGNVAQSTFSVVQPTVQTVQPVQPVQPVQTVQTVQPAVQSFFAQTKAVQQPNTRFVYDNRFLFENQQPQFISGPVQSFPNFAQNIVHFAPQPQVATVQTVPAFASNGFDTGAFGPVTVGKIAKQFPVPTVVSQPAPVPSFPAFASVSSVPTVQTGFAVPSVSSGSLPVSSFPSTNSAAGVVAPVSGKVFSDNRISSPNTFTTVSQSQLPVFSQEKQSADTVQTTEW